MLVFTITVEEVVEEGCYDEDGLYFDEDDGVWYCVDEDGVEYWFDEGCDDWVECEYDEDFTYTDEQTSDEICYYEE